MIGIGIVGFKNSGKTTLALKLAREFKSRGLSVCAAKFSHHSFDREGTDTSALSEVCDVVASITDDEAAVVWPKKRFLPDLLPLLESDVLLIEGGKSIGWLPRIILPASNGSDSPSDLSPELAIATYNGNLDGLKEYVDIPSLADLVLEKGFILPGLDCDECGRETCRAMTEAILIGEASPENCKAMNSSVEVTVSGRPIGLNHFAEKIVSGTVRGMLSGLKGFSPGEIVVRIK